MWQNVFAGAGYVVLTPNPRGGTGRGTAYAAALNAAWGSVDVPEDLGLVDLAVAKGFPIRTSSSSGDGRTAGWRPII